MSNRQMLLTLTGVALSVSGAVDLRAQYAAPPDSYSITQTNSMFGPVASTVHIYRDGSQALIESSNPPVQAGASPVHFRSLFDLKAHTSITLDLNDPSAPCGSGSFSGDWGDPFAASSEVTADLKKQKAAPSGTATVNGVATNVFEAALPDGGKAKAWIDPKFGLVLRLQLSQGAGAPRTIIETQQISFDKPPASAFAMPAACTAAPPPSAVPSEADHIAQITGGPASDFADATHPPAAASNGACAVRFRVLQAPSMTPLTSGFQVYVDSEPRVVQNGVVVIDNAPEHFDMDLRVSSGGATALIYRQCAGPRTTLLLVVKDLDKLSAGADWLWVKSGKFAAQ